MDELIINNTPSLEKMILQKQGNGTRIIQAMVEPKLGILDYLHTDMMPTV
jgi:hypothetical protein